MQEINPQAMEAGTHILGRIQGAVQVHRDGIRKAKVHLELNVARDVKNNEGFCRYTDQKRRTK